jgi:hypothetical protein
MEIAYHEKKKKKKTRSKPDHRETKGKRKNNAREKH